MDRLPDDPILGLIPAAGKALRLGRLPVSKELLPVAFDEAAGEPVARVAASYLLERFRGAGIGRAFLVLDEEKTEVARFLGAGPEGGPRLAYLLISGSRSLPETLRHALPFLGESTVALGFPDVLFEPADAYVHLLTEYRRSGADLVLGCFPAPDPRSTDMVDLAADGRVRAIEVRPAASRLTLNWLLAVWGPRFSRLLAAVPLPSEGPEAQLGGIFEQALREGLSVRGVAFPDGSYLDLGTPEGVAAMWTNDFFRSS